MIQKVEEKDTEKLPVLARKGEKVSLHQWLIETKRLLEIEWKNEQEVAAEKLNILSKEALIYRTLSVHGLKVLEVSTGLYGRQIVQFQAKQKICGFGNVSCGDVVRCVSNDFSPKVLTALREAFHDRFDPVSGVVLKTDDHQRIIEVAFDADASHQAGKGVEFGDYIDTLNSLKSNSMSGAQRTLLRLDKLPNVKTKKVLLNTLDELEKMGIDYHPIVLSTIFGEAQCRSELQIASCDGEAAPSQVNKSSESAYLNQLLNDSQKIAIQRCLGSRDVSLIHGPPGTGKTTTVVELIQQAVQHCGQKVLVCAPSNIAVDNIVVRLQQQRKAHSIKSRSKRGAAARNRKQKAQQGAGMEINAVRLGHPARFLPEVLELSMESVLRKREESKIVETVRSEVNMIVRTLFTKCDGRKQEKKGRDQRKHSKHKKVDYRQLRSELKVLRKELRQREKKLSQSVVESANVVCCTTIGVNQLKRYFPSSKAAPPPFDMLIIDEAAQGLELSCYVPLKYAKKIVLVGDHKQLPPTIKSDACKNSLLDVTLFYRLEKLYGERITTLLDVQYRMNTAINHWPSSEFYHSKLHCHETVATRRLAETVSVVETSVDGESVVDRKAPLVLIDTSFSDMPESFEFEAQVNHSSQIAGRRHTVEGSKLNECEAELVLDHLFFLLDEGMNPSEVAVVTPYSAQVQCIKSKLAARAEHEKDKATFQENVMEKVEVRTVDGFQGQEKSAIILSLVRSNPRNVIGFLNDPRRMNVAITRAKLQVCLICNTETLLNSVNEAGEKNAWLCRMIDYFQQNAAVVILDAPEAGIEAPPREKSAKHVQHHGGETTEQQVLSAELQQQVKGFIDGPEDDKSEACLALPIELTAGERRLVHLFCDELNQGLCERRQIVHISKEVQEEGSAGRQLYLFRNQTEYEAFLSQSSSDPMCSSKVETTHSELDEQVVEEASSQRDPKQRAESADAQPSKVETVIYVLGENPGDDMGSSSSSVEKEAEAPRDPGKDGMCHDSEHHSESNRDDDVSASIGQRPSETVQQSNPVSKVVSEARTLQAEKYRQHLEQKQQAPKRKARKKKGKKASTSGKGEASIGNKIDSQLQKNVEEEDDLAFLDRMIAATNACAVSECREGGRFTMFTCKSCKLRYCGSHRYSFTHSCDDRGERDTAAPRSGGSSQKKALQKKLTSLQQSRQQKVKSKPKSKKG